MHFGQFRLRLVAIPERCLRGEGLRDGVEMRRRIFPDHPVPLEQPLDETRDHLRIRLGESFVHDEDIGDDEQIAVRRQQRCPAFALLDRGGCPRCPGDTTHHSLIAAIQVGEEVIACHKGIIRIDEVDLVRGRFVLHPREHVHTHAGFLREVADEEVALGEL
jgi:hypothetical protein